MLGVAGCERRRLHDGTVVLMTKMLRMRDTSKPADPHDQRRTQLGPKIIACIVANFWKGPRQSQQFYS